MTAIDLNCDMGEAPGVEPLPNDAILMNYISSANIACGFHAGGPEVMRQTVNLALSRGVAIGAHPSLPDRENFGRREMAISPAETYGIVQQQIKTLQGIVQAAGGALHHVKPHGALYNMAARDAALAAAVAQAVYDFNGQLVLYALAGSHMITAAARLGLRTASEAFADRTYQDDGSLTPRAAGNALITDARQSLNQVLKMITHKSVISVNHRIVPLTAETICLHSDGAHAVEFAQLINQRLTDEGIAIKSPVF
ncbi:LamB/YcsF family protein [Mucilaginibacter hurinus]|uniref:LamB/YcsF family protein n=1 Tax=Mucilaginibacter hurinus TaxID=2201324 RepID=A0A367GTQ1_9SPHI|nr:5-oxoprolinase subunit PxpA [Mucilaginibacter hurinus]RCH56206.1 LamB/YcsF family protein [Mucilaginibacter hurinus]